MHKDKSVMLLGESQMSAEYYPKELLGALRRWERAENDV